MPSAAETSLFSPGWRVTLTALKCSGTSVTVGSLVAATTVRVIAGGVGVVCAVAEAGSAIAPSNNSPVVLNCMIASQVQRIIRAPYALPAPPEMAGRFKPPESDSSELNQAVALSFCLSMIFQKTGFHFSGSCSIGRKPEAKAGRN